MDPTLWPPPRWPPAPPQPAHNPPTPPPRTSGGPSPLRQQLLLRSQQMAGVCACYTAAPTIGILDARRGAVRRQPAHSLQHPTSCSCGGAGSLPPSAPAIVSANGLSTSTRRLVVRLKLFFTSARLAGPRMGLAEECCTPTRSSPTSPCSCGSQTLFNLNLPPAAAFCLLESTPHQLHPRPAHDADERHALQRHRNVPTSTTNCHPPPPQPLICCCNLELKG